MDKIRILGLAASAAAAAALCGCGRPGSAPPLVEEMPVASLCGQSPRDCARLTGERRVWDFSDGRLPSGGRLNSGAALSGSGIVSTAPTNVALAAGFALDGLWTPEGAFLFEADVTFGAMCATNLPPCSSILWDDMAITYAPKHTHRGFQLAMEVRSGRCTPVLFLGFSNATERVAGPAVRVAPGKSASVSFFFSAAGRVVWEFGGERLDCALDHVGPLAPSRKFRPVIGDRAVSNHHPFDGAVRRVAVSACERDAVAVVLEGRTAFVRGETNAVVSVRVRNAVEAALSNVCVVVEQFVESGRVRRTERRIDGIPAGGDALLACGIETRVRPGWRTMRVSADGCRADGGGRACVSRIFRVGVGPRVGDAMPALMWGYDPGLEGVIADFGFTHALRYAAPGHPDLARAYDEAVVSGVRLLHSMRAEFPGGSPDAKYARTDRRGKVRPHGKGMAEEVSNPAFVEAMMPLVRKDAELYGTHPGFVGVLAISEARDASAPSFNTEHLRYRAETGRDVPPEVEERTIRGARGLAASKARFPDGVVPPDDPVLSYYRWFWKGGDGWPGYSGAISDEYHRLIDRPEFFVFWDPAVRCPPIWGSGGTVDMLNQWVYSVPEPMNVAGPAEEVLAMVAGRPGQRPAIMTQLICYRSQIAPKGVKVSPEPEWVRRRPLADFPSIPPDSLQEATWSMLAKPVQAVMYHGWGTIYETGRATGYTYTNPESAERLRRLLKEVVAPLGPTLKRLGRAESPVAVLESFTTCALGGPSPWGWKSAPVMFLQRARLDPRVVYEETILRDGLEGVRVLYAPQCLFLVRPVVERIRKFQSEGGILVADGQLLPALRADVTVPLVSFAPPPASDHTEDVDAMEASREGDAKTRLGTMRAKSAMQKQAEDLRRDLAPRYAPEADSSSPEIVVYGRRWNGVRYLFAVNDRRTFGRYVGQWGLTMESGLPFEGSVSLADDGSVAAVYELSRGGEAAFSRSGGRIVVPVRYETNDGRLFAFLGERIASVRVDAPAKVRAGDAMRVTFQALGASGRPVDALLPGEVRAFDGAGRELDGAGFVCLQGGSCTVEIQTNLDDADGGYRIVCRDRASGLSAERAVRRVAR